MHDRQPRPRPTAWRVGALAADWGLPPSQVYRLIRDGRLHAVRVGKHYLVADTEVQAFLAAPAEAA